MNGLYSLFVLGSGLFLAVFVPRIARFCWPLLKAWWQRNQHHVHGLMLVVGIVAGLWLAILITHRP